MSWFKDFLKNFGAPEENFGSNFTPRAQQVLALARKEADRFNHNYLGTEHILLGLIKLGKGVAFNVFERLGLLNEHEGPAAEIFKIFKVDRDQLRQKILDELKPPGNDAQKG